MTLQESDSNVEEHPWILQPVVWAVGLVGVLLLCGCVFGVVLVLRASKANLAATTTGSIAPVEITIGMTGQPVSGSSFVLYVTVRNPSQMPKTLGSIDLGSTLSTDLTFLNAKPTPASVDQASDLVQIWYHAVVLPEDSNTSRIELMYPEPGEYELVITVWITGELAHDVPFAITVVEPETSEGVDP